MNNLEDPTFPPLVDAYNAPRGLRVRAIGADDTGQFIDVIGYVVIGARRIVDGPHRRSTPDDPISLVVNERADESGEATAVVLPANGKVFALGADPCAHAWVAGMMNVHDEDVAAVAAARPVECERCGQTYGQDHPNT